MSEFNNLFNYIIDETILNKENSLLNNYYNESISFCEIYKSLITEDYNIFPVPKFLLNDMIDFVLCHDPLDETFYDIKSLHQNYLINWKYYKQFKENLQLMLNKNINCTIILVLFKTETDLLKILEKYPNEIIKNKIDNSLKGIIWDYDDKFNLCLAVNCSIKSRFELNKIIQHELIHWMQTVLNSETKKTYSIFDNLKFNLSPSDYLFLSNYLSNTNLLNYVLNGVEFEPWVANTCEEFIYSGLTIEQYEDIIKNRNKFVQIITDKSLSYGQKEMYLFGEICYLTSINNKDDRYYYLIEALKEND